MSQTIEQGLYYPDGTYRNREEIIEKTKKRIFKNQYSVFKTEQQICRGMVWGDRKKKQL